MAGYVRGRVIHLPATEFVDRPTAGRTFAGTRPVRLGDVDVRARLRFDAIARYLQDIATDDATDAQLGDAFGWVVRRTMIEVRQAARLDERLDLITFCGGTGRSWAERRTSIAGDHGASIEAVSLWIRIDPSTGRPTGLGDDFMSAFGEAARGRDECHLVSGCRHRHLTPIGDRGRSVESTSIHSATSTTQPSGRWSRRRCPSIGRGAASRRSNTSRQSSADDPIELRTCAPIGRRELVVVDDSDATLTAARWTPAS